LDVALRECGLTLEQYQVIDALLGGPVDSALSRVKRNIQRVRELKRALEPNEQAMDANALRERLRILEGQRRERIAAHIKRLFDVRATERWKQSTNFRKVVRRLARDLGKSKKAHRTFDEVRRQPELFKCLLEIIPVWIMELDSASRILPLIAGMFDYVILDEASQCNIAYTLPSMFRARKALFVGDKHQMRDATILFKANRALEELALRYGIPKDFQIKAPEEAVKSVLDIGWGAGWKQVTLLYHYRSVPELIGFCNDNFYFPVGIRLIPVGGRYLTYDSTNKVLLVHQVEVDESLEISDKTNSAEARAILALFRELRSNERYRDKSVAVLSFFNAQAKLIRKLFEDAGYKEEADNYKVSIIEGIQGDEKDIVIYSFVIRTADQKNMYVPLTGERGDIRADVNRGRVNVAFSRARLQVHCFTSLPLVDIPEGIWIKRYLQYVSESPEVGLEVSEIRDFGSTFEQEFYELARVHLDAGYVIRNQVRSCGFLIDFVITNARNGRAIAVECDGPTHFKDETDEATGKYEQRDEERQSVLEAAGWSFYRIKYSDWINKRFNREKTILDLIEKLG
jgi:very-short-patch-repair endonuclease